MTVSDAIGHALFKEAADQSFHAITVTRDANADNPGEIVYVNDAFTEMTGYEADEVIGESPGMLQGPKTDQSVLNRLNQKIRRNERFHGETINYRKDGSEFTIEWKVLPIIPSPGAHFWFRKYTFLYRATGFALKEAIQ